MFRDHLHALAMWEEVETAIVFALTGWVSRWVFWLYALRPRCEAGLENFWKYQSKNISFLFMYISHFISYWELFISFSVSKYRRTWLWNPMVSGNLSERKRRRNEPVIRQTLLLCSSLCSLKSKHFVFFFLLQPFLLPLTCWYFIYDSSLISLQMIGTLVERLQS